MYKQKFFKRKEPFNPHCVSKNGKRLEKAFKLLERRQELEEGGYFGDKIRRASVGSAVDFDEECWIDKNRSSAFGGGK